MAAGCEQDTIRIINRARHRLRWIRANTLLGVLLSGIFLTLAVAIAVNVLAHLREHGVPASQLLVVINEAQHPSGVWLGIIVTGIFLGGLFLVQAFATLVMLYAVRCQSEDLRLLVALWELHYGHADGKDTASSSETGA